MIQAGVGVYAIANLVVAVMVVCMLFSVFIKSTDGFRLALGALAVASLGCFFLALDLLRDMVLQRFEFGDFLFMGFCQLVQTIALAAVLVMMRMKQVRERQHEHPRQRQARGIAGDFAEG